MKGLAIANRFTIRDEDRPMTENQQAPGGTVDNVHRQARTSSAWAWCLGVMAVAFLLLAAVATFFSSRPLQISHDTTYLTGPLMSNGKRIDYFAAIEQAIRPENAATQHNGYRLLALAVKSVHGLIRDSMAAWYCRSNRSMILHYHDPGRHHRRSSKAWTQSRRNSEAVTSSPRCSAQSSLHRHKVEEGGSVVVERTDAVVDGRSESKSPPTDLGNEPRNEGDRACELDQTAHS
jgi:hypothetical protein